MANLITDDAVALTWAGANRSVSVKTFKTHLQVAEFAMNQLSLDEMKKFRRQLQKHITAVQRQSDAVRRWQLNVPTED